MLAFLYTQNRVGGKIPSTLKIIEPNKKAQEVFADLFAKELLEGVTTFPRIDNAQSYSFLELSCFYIKRILEMKERKVQTLFVEGKPEPAIASALLQARDMGLNVVIKLKTTESNSETQEEFKELGLDDVVMA